LESSAGHRSPSGKKSARAKKAKISRDSQVIPALLARMASLCPQPAVALGLPGCRAVIDDLAARKCAASLGIPVIGTLGIVLRARRQGIIPAARPVVEDLLRGGMFLSRSLLDRALALVDE
jgi:hypothetical protein